MELQKALSDSMLTVDRVSSLQYEGNDGLNVIQCISSIRLKFKMIGVKEHRMIFDGGPLSG